jgi:hypothetical protein
MFTFLAENRDTANQTEEIKISLDKELDELESSIVPKKLGAIGEV